MASAFTKANAWSGFILSPTLDIDNMEDAELDALLRAGSGYACHGVGTVRMTARDSDVGVVDPDLRVKGISGLRVVDASIMVRFVFWT
jgi:choline dehydrogenase-like flavoprotein